MRGDALIPCEACSRHVRCSEAACPFCGVAVSASRAARTQEPFRRMAAAAAVAAGVASVAGCSSTHSVGVFYGSPGIIDSGNQDECEGGAEAGVEAGPEGGSVVAFYGAASFDGGTGLTDAPEQG